jgi:membrane-associated phospholipid phosphatase
MGCLVLQCFGTAAMAQTPDDGEQRVCSDCGFGRDLVEDTRDVFTAPARWRKPQWRSAAVKAGVVVGSIALLDEPVRDYLQDHRSDTTDRIADAFEPFGREYAFAVLGGFALAGALTDNPMARNVARDGAISSLITSVLIVPALKELAGRSRPRTDLGALQFNPFSGEESFPSGHAAAAFTIAASIAMNNDHFWVKSLSYGIAGLVGYARMEKDAHWLSDVTASAFIGIGVTKGVSKLNHERRGITLTPAYDGEVPGIRFSKAF